MLAPLPERLRPKTIAGFVGQQHLIGEGKVLRKLIESGNIPSIIFWGPPGVGKTSLARFIAEQIKMPFFQLSAIESGVKEVREVEVSVLGNEEPQASVCGEILPSREFYSYESKYIDGTSGLLIPSPLPEEISKPEVPRVLFL